MKLGLKDVSILRSDKSVSLFLPGSSKFAFVAAHYKTRLHSILPFGQRALRRRLTFASTSSDILLSES